MPHLIYSVDLVETQGHWIENSLQKKPHYILAANRKVNEIGSKARKGAWRCNNYCMEKARHQLALPSFVKCEIVSGFGGWGEEEKNCKNFPKSPPKQRDFYGGRGPLVHELQTEKHFRVQGQIKSQEHRENARNCAETEKDKEDVSLLW